MANQVVWVDIPCVDLDRAIAFYTAVLGQKVEKDSFPGTEFGVLPHAGQDVGGCLIVDPVVKPSEQGLLVYFNCTGRLEAAVQAAIQSGGRLLVPAHQIGPHGFKAVVIDSEGNRIALHSV